MSSSSSIQTKFEPHDPQPNDENNISQQNILESAMGSGRKDQIQLDSSFELQKVNAIDVVAYFIRFLVIM